ncbi:M1 family aminopeptidase [Ferruginibacter sp.]
MKKHYSFIVLFVLLCKISTAQVKGSNGFTFGNDLFINNQILADQDNAGNEQKSNLSPEKAAHYKAVENKITAAISGKDQAAMMVPGTGTNYDVKYYRLELRINPDTSIGKYIKGKVTIYFKTLQANFSVANFDMATALASDSVYYHGAKLAAGNISRATADLIAITIPNIPVSGTVDSVSIFYKGVPPTIAGFSGGTGFVKSTHSSAPVRNYVYTLSEPYSSFSWWPCKSFVVNDKADSMDMIISTPLNFKTAGNGALVYEITSATEVRTYWKERYPIAAYQVATAVANYVQYPTIADTVLIGGTKTPYYNYLFPETNTAAAQTALNRVKLMLTTYSTLFSDYPFKNEKYGNYTFGFGGGMEHNTFSGENPGVYNATTDWDVLAHELAHQWWGASVTCGSWHDIWVNESFADYSEALLLEFNPAIATSVGVTDSTWRTAKKTATIGANVQATYVTDTSSILTIFTPSVYIYDRGGMIITMLRTLLGDTKFFQALRNYQTDPLLSNGNSFTADVKRHMEATSGLNLTTFFNQWIYNTGYARYNSVKWNNSGTNIIINLGAQTPQNSPLSHFDIPIALRIKGSLASMDTTVIIYDQAGVHHYVNNGVLTPASSNVLQFNLSFVPTTLVFDSRSQAIATAAAPAKTAVLSAEVLTFTGIKENNKANLNWNINNSHEYSSFEIERSADGVSFEKLSTIKAIDNPNRIEFSYVDFNILNGTGYYRIKVVQKDGSFIYSKTINIENKADYYYTITPNPAKSYIVITGSGVKGNADIIIHDATGRVVKKIMNQSFTNNNNLKISVEDLGVGNYFVEIQKANAETYTRQIVIIR